MKRKLYVVTMYRWGDRELHSYVEGVFTKKLRAMKAGECETQNRGGKYYPEVLEYSENEIGGGKDIVPLKKNPIMMDPKK